LLASVPGGLSGVDLDLLAILRATEESLKASGVAEWCEIDFNIVRDWRITRHGLRGARGGGKERAIAGAGGTTI